MAIPFDKFEQQIFLGSVLIENLTDGELGTGFLVRKPVNEQRVKMLLFSNKHVFWGKKDHNNAGVSKQVRLTLHVNDGEGAYNLGSTHQIVGMIHRMADAGYYEHPSAEVDVACINISTFFDALPIATRHIDFDDFSNFSMSQLYAGSPVLFVGYPTGFYDKKNCLPVLRIGHIASIPEVDFDGQPQVLIDAPVFPGSSGSPVFSALNGQYKLLGIISHAAINALDFVELPAPANTIAASKANVVKIPVQYIGLGMLFKIETLRHVFDLA